MAKECEHSMRFVGTYHWLGNLLPGSRIDCERVYGDRYACSKCGHRRYLNTRVEGDTRSPPIDEVPGRR